PPEANAWSNRTKLGPQSRQRRHRHKKKRVAKRCGKSAPNGRGAARHPVVRKVKKTPAARLERRSPRLEVQSLRRVRTRWSRSVNRGGRRRKNPPCRSWIPRLHLTWTWVRWT